MPELRFTVPGVPATKGSWRPIRLKAGRTVLLPDSKRSMPWEQVVRVTALQARDAAGLAMVQDGPVWLTCMFWLPKPKSAPKRRKTWPSKKPDLGKLIRCVEDAMTGVVYRDDAQIVGYPDAAKEFHPDGRVGVDICVTWLAEGKEQP